MWRRNLSERVLECNDRQKHEHNISEHPSLSLPWGIYNSISLRTLRLAFPDPVPGREAWRQPHDGRDHALDEKVIRPSWDVACMHAAKARKANH